MLQRLAVILLFVCGFGSSVKFVSAQDTPTKPAFAGPTETGYLLPNGWHLTPVGNHVETSDMVLNIRPLADNRHAIATTNGFNDHKLMLVDLVDRKIIAEEKSLQSWFGLAVNKAESKVWWSGAVPVSCTSST